VSPAEDLVPGKTEYRQNRADHEHEYTDYPEDVDGGNKADDEQNNAEDNQGAPDVSPPSGHGGNRGTNVGWLFTP
jgi:hypothetical protein